MIPVAAAYLHVTWFKDPSRYPVRADLIVSWRTALTVAACLITLLLLFGLQRLLGDPNWPELDIFKRMAVGAPTLVAVQSAVTLVFYGVQPAPVTRPAPGLDPSRLRAGGPRTLDCLLLHHGPP